MISDLGAAGEVEYAHREIDRGEDGGHVHGTVYARHPEGEHVGDDRYGGDDGRRREKHACALADERNGQEHYACYRREHTAHGPDEAGTVHHQGHGINDGHGPGHGHDVQCDVVGVVDHLATVGEEHHRRHDEEQRGHYSHAAEYPLIERSHAPL